MYGNTIASISGRRRGDPPDPSDRRGWMSVDRSSRSRKICTYQSGQCGKSILMAGAPGLTRLEVCNAGGTDVTLTGDRELALGYCATDSNAAHGSAAIGDARNAARNDDDAAMSQVVASKCRRLEGLAGLMSRDAP